MGSFNGRAGTQLLAMSSVEKGPEISDTGAPAISEETEGGKATDVKGAVIPITRPRTWPFALSAASQVALAATFRRPQCLSVTRGVSVAVCLQRVQSPSCWTDSVSQGLQVLSPHGRQQCAEGYRSIRSFSTRMEHQAGERVPLVSRVAVCPQRGWARKSKKHLEQKPQLHLPESRGFTLWSHAA